MNTEWEDSEAFDLKPNRFDLDSSGEFVDSDGEPVGIDVSDTGGCSAWQIIEMPVSARVTSASLGNS